MLWVYLGDEVLDAKVLHSAERPAPVLVLSVTSLHWNGTAVTFSPLCQHTCCCDRTIEVACFVLRWHETMTGLPRLPCMLSPTRPCSGCTVPALRARCRASESPHLWTCSPRFCVQLAIEMDGPTHFSSNKVDPSDSGLQQRSDPDV